MYDGWIVLRWNPRCIRCYKGESVHIDAWCGAYLSTVMGADSDDGFYLDRNRDYQHE